jgi:hypothetical protein
MLPKLFMVMVIMKVASSLLLLSCALITKGSAHVDQELFWQLIETSHGDADQLIELLLAHSKEEIIAFHTLLDDALYQLDRKDIQAVTDGSDDGFEYARLSIVSRGRHYFEAVLRNPHEAELDEDNEPFGTAAQKAYERKWQEPFPELPNRRATGKNRAGWAS